MIYVKLPIYLSITAIKKKKFLTKPTDEKQDILQLINKKFFLFQFGFGLTLLISDCNKFYKIFQKCLQFNSLIMFY